MPIPVSLEQKAGTFRLTEKTSIGIPKGNADIQKTARRLADFIRTSTGLDLIITESSPEASIQLLLSKTTIPQIAQEGYLLDVNPDKVTLQANQPSGLFYGIHTILQLLPPAIERKKQVDNTDPVMPCVKIMDYPRFGWRGLMFDVSRHFFSKEYIKSYIDQMAKYKFNVFHWHLTDDQGWRVEIKSLPKLTEKGAWRVARYSNWNERKPPVAGEPTTYGGFYTQEDIKEVVRYAQERYITIIPEIDVPGHSLAAVVAYPELSCTQNRENQVNPGAKMSEWYGNGKFKILLDNTLNPSNEKVYEFLDKVFTEIAALFPAPYIHMGGDECYKGYWEADPGCQTFMKKMNLKDAHELQSYFVKRVEKIIEKKGKKMIGWDEILEGGLAPNATVMSWQGTKGGIEAANLKHPVVMSPHPVCYLDLYQGDPLVEPPTYSMARLKDTYSFEPIPEGVDSIYILGGQGNLWTENVPNPRHAEYMTYPRALAIAEMLWSPKHKRNWQDFVNRLETQFERLDAAEVNYARSMYDPIFKVSKNDKGNLVIELSTEVDGLELYYSMDNTFPDKYSPRYTQPLEMPQGTALLRLITYRNGKPVGKMISAKVMDLEKRVKK